MIGATVHTPFAVTSRSVFGYWGSKFAVFSRMVIACFWLSINSWSGGAFITQVILAIWPSYANLHNSIPASQGMTSADFLSFFLFWLLQLPLVFVHPSKLKWVFRIKAVLVPAVAFGTLIWAVQQAKKQGDLSAALTSLSNRAPAGKARYSAFMSATTAAMGTWATLSLNIGDFSRYCKKPSAAYVQLTAIPLLYALISIIGAITAACTYAIYDTALYQQYEVIAEWNGTHAGRAAMFFAGLIWALANVTTNITANSISAANDMTSLAPKYINIKRGQLISITIGVFGFAPWKVLANAINFLNFMSSYSIVLAPMAALLCTDFFIIKKRKLNIYELYKPDGIYRFSKGWNWRAYVALGVAIAVNLPGMINAINSTVGIGGYSYVYQLSNIVGDLLAVSIYLVLNYFFPPHTSIIDEPVHDLLDYAYDGAAVPYAGTPEEVDDPEKRSYADRIEPVAA